MVEADVEDERRLGALRLLLSRGPDALARGLTCKPLNDQPTACMTLPAASFSRGKLLDLKSVHEVGRARCGYEGCAWSRSRAASLFTSKAPSRLHGGLCEPLASHKGYFGGNMRQRRYTCGAARARATRVGRNH